MLKKYASKVFSSWMIQNQEAVLSLLERGESLLDLGCGDAKLTQVVNAIVKAKKCVGIDLFGKTKKIKIIKSDLNKKLPFKDESFDIVISHYSLEHLYNTGVFISETYRVLKEGGYTVVTTDNLSAWPNIVSLILGFQPFSTTTGIGQRAIGNPLALRANFGEVQDKGIDLEWRKFGEYSHNKVLSYQALTDSYKHFGFDVENVIGIGYFPFGGKLSKLLANLDKRHAHLLALKARKR